MGGKQINTQHIVVLVHGIRDRALWRETIRATLSEKGFKVYSTNYGRFDLFRFLIPISYFRGKVIEKVLNQINVVKQNARDEDISIIAHSFGTYVVSKIIEAGFYIKFKRVIFCGSVVKYDFPFERYQSRFEAPILNEVGTRDIWPAMAESVTWGYGSVGTYGFHNPLVQDRWHNGAKHGYFLKADFCAKYWVPFLESGEIISDNPDPERPRLWIRTLSFFRIKGIVLAFIALWAYFALDSSIMRTRFTVMPVGPMLLLSGESVTFVLNLKRDGPIDVTMRYEPLHPPGQQEGHDTPPLEYTPPLEIDICSLDVACPAGGLIDSGRSFRRELRSGPAVVRLYRPPANPGISANLGISFSATITYPQ